MAAFDFVQTSLSAGELSPRLRGRIDFEKFYDGMERLENFIVLPQGGATRRPGTRFVGEVKFRDKFTRLIPFAFSTTQTYMLEFGESYIRVYRDEAQLSFSDGIDAVDQGDDTFTVNGADYTDSLVANTIIAVDGSTGNDGIYHVVSSALDGSDTVITVAEEIPDATADGNVLLPVEISTPYQEEDLPLIKFTQSADVLFLFHPDYSPRELQRLSDTNWQLVEFDFEDGPYLDENLTATTLALSGTSGSVTVTASAVTGINNDTGFQTTDIGRLIRWQDPATNWTWLEITAHTDTTHVTATIQGPNASAGTATDAWRLGAWSNTTGWPQVATFFKERLALGATDDEPQTGWLSNVDDLTNFAPSAADGTVSDANAITFTIADNQVNAIRWFSARPDGLVIGTSGSEVVLTTAVSVDPFGPGNLEVKRQSNRGSDAGALPEKIGHSILFIQRGGMVLRELLFDFNVDSYITRNLSLLSEHLLRRGGFDLAYQQNPESILWMAENNGELVGLTFERDQEVFGWHHHKMGGTFSGSFPVVESIATITEGNIDQLWQVTKRTIDGGTVRYIEFMEEPFDAVLDEVDDIFYVDSGLTGDSTGSPTDTWAGLDHLEGETVSVLADGSVHPDVVVTNGAITLQREAEIIQVGFGYTSGLDTLPIELITDTNTTRGKTKRVHQVHVLFDETLGGMIGPKGGPLDFVLTRGSGPMNSPPPIFSETKSVPISGRHTKDAQITIEQRQPLPMTILNIVMEMQFHGS
jgi:hypothetical protein